MDNADLNMRVNLLVVLRKVLFIFRQHQTVIKLMIIDIQLFLSDLFGSPFKHVETHVLRSNEFHVILVTYIG